MRYVEKMQYMNQRCRAMRPVHAFVLLSSKQDAGYYNVKTLNSVSSDILAESLPHRLSSRKLHCVDKARLI